MLQKALVAHTMQLAVALAEIPPKAIALSMVAFQAMSYRFPHRANFLQLNLECV